VPDPGSVESSYSTWVDQFDTLAAMIAGLGARHALAAGGLHLGLAHGHGALNPGWTPL
jgi:hypothetical protein